MARKFSHWNLVRCLLELKNLLIDKLTLLMDNEIWVHGAAIRNLLVSVSSTGPGQCDAGKAACHREILRVRAILALDMDER